MIKKSIRNKKTALLLITVMLALLVVCVGTGGVLAYFTADSAKINNYNIGQAVDYLNVNYDPVLLTDPAASTEGISSPLTVTNNQTDKGNENWVSIRIRIDFSDEAMLRCLNITFDTANWSAKDSSGFYYCKIPVEPGGTTPSLFEKIKVTDKTNIQNYEMFFRAEARNCPKNATWSQMQALW